MWPCRHLFGARFSSLLGVNPDVGLLDPLLSFQIGFPGRCAIVGSRRRRSGAPFLRSLAGSVPRPCQVVGTHGRWLLSSLGAWGTLHQPTSRWEPPWVHLQTVTQSPTAALGWCVGAAPPLTEQVTSGLSRVSNK